MRFFLNPPPKQTYQAENQMNAVFIITSRAPGSPVHGYLGELFLCLSHEIEVFLPKEEEMSASIPKISPPDAQNTGRALPTVDHSPLTGSH